MDWTLAIVGGWGRAEDRWLSSREFHDNPHRVVGVTADQKNSDCRRRAGFSLESGRGRHRECPGATTAPTTAAGMGLHAAVGERLAEMQRRPAASVRPRPWRPGNSWLLLAGEALAVCRLVVVGVGQRDL